MEGVWGISEGKMMAFSSQRLMEGSLCKIGKNIEKMVIWRLNGKNSFPLKYGTIVNSNHFVILRKAVFIALLIRHGWFWGEVTQDDLSLTHSKGNSGIRFSGG